MTSQNNRHNLTSEATASYLLTEVAPSYHPAALANATDLLRRAVSPDAAAVFSAVVTLRPRGSKGRELNLATLTSLADLGSDQTIAAERLFVVDDALFRQLGVRLMALSDEADSRRRNRARGWSSRAASDGAEMAQAQPSTITLSDELCVLLDVPHPAAPISDLPVVDTVTAIWVEACRAAACSGTGHHLALRVVAEDGREFADFAGLVAADGSRVDVVTGATRSTLLRAVLRAELHAGESGHVVVVAGLTLFEDFEATKLFLAILRRCVVLHAENTPRDRRSRNAYPQGLLLLAFLEPRAGEGGKPEAPDRSRRFASDTSRPPYLAFQLYNVASDITNFRQRSAPFAPTPARVNCR